MRATLASRKSRNTTNKPRTEDDNNAVEDKASRTSSNSRPSSSSSKEIRQEYSLRSVLGISLLLLVCAYLHHHATNEDHTGPLQNKLKASSPLAMSLSSRKDEPKNSNKAVAAAAAAADVTAEKQQLIIDDSINKKNRFVTIVMPSVVNPKGRRRRLETIEQTWGPESRAVYVIHNLQEEFPSPPTTGFPQVLQVPSNITFDDGLPRLYHVIRQAYKEWDSDFYFFVNDHTYVIPSHLCYYLQNEDPEQSMYAGHALKNQREAFNSGAAGYVLSRTMMRRLIEKFDAQDSQCVVSGDKWLQGNPGLVTALCLHHALDTKAVDTRESGKYHRFHAFPLVRMAMGKVDQWYINKHENLLAIMGFDDSYGTMLKGRDCCSAETISFHYVEVMENQALFEVRQELLKNPDMSDDDLQALVTRLYPSEWKQLGGYSRLLPDPKKEADSWAEILAVYRKLALKEYELKC